MAMDYRKQLTMRRVIFNVGVTLVLVSFIFAISAPDLVLAAERGQESQALGKVSSILLRHEMVYIENPILNNYIDRIIRRITVANNLSNDYRAVIVNDLIPNTFSVSDGSIYITTGLLDMINEDSALAFVLAHEIAHIEASDMLNTFSSIKTKRTAIIAAGTAVAIGLMIVTVGMSAAAMGPMASATTSSMMITNVGTIAATSVLGAAIIPPKFDDIEGMEELSKIRFGRVGIHSEGKNHPVYAPALFGSLIEGIYHGYSQDKETEINNIALSYLSNSSFEVDGGKSLASKLVEKMSDPPLSHLESFSRQLIDYDDKDKTVTQ
jgi:hypothetical protein